MPTDIALMRDVVASAVAQPPWQDRSERSEFDVECFELGRASAAAGQRLDEKGPKAYKESFAAFRGKTRHPAYVERKLLSLRLSAVKRGMVVDATVTPQHLRKLLVERCPVTLEPFDYGKNGKRNPSMDRLVNEVSYRAGNICLLSKRANSGKGERSFKEVVELAEEGQPRFGLEGFEWMRLASLMYGAWARAYSMSDPYLVPLAALPGHGIFTSTSQTVQLLLTRQFSPGRDHQRAFARWAEMTHAAACELDVLRVLTEPLLEALTDCPHKGDVWLNPDIFSAFSTWFNRCQHVVVPAIEGRMAELQSKFPEPSAGVDWLAVSPR